MKEEKMMILSMLEEGKITSEEAIKLLEALEDMEINKESVQFTKENFQNDFQEKNTSKPRFNSLGDIGFDISNVLSDVFSGLKDIGGSFNFRGNYETITTDLDMDLSDIENPSLDLRAINGSIRLWPNDGSKILIKSTCQYKNGFISPDEPYFDFYMDGDKVVFNPKYNSNISIKLDVSLPRKHFDEILLNSTNGKINLSQVNANILRSITTNSSIDLVEVKAKEIDLTTKNGRIECRGTDSNSLKAITTNSNIFLMNVNSKEIDGKTANAKISIKDIDAGKIVCKTSNSSIEADAISCDIIHLLTSNGKITFDNMDLKRVKDIKLITSNASINSGIYQPGIDSYFDLETSMGNISIEIPSLIYKINKQANLGFKKIVAHTIDFDENKDHLKFTASTSNGSIKIY